MGRRRGRTQFGPFAAVDVEGLVALVDLADERVENQAVRAELLGGYAVDALVEFVALSGVFVLAVLWRAFELGVCGSIYAKVKG